jgi:hypothetical protein
LFNYIIASFLIRIEVGFKEIGKEKEFQDGKHDEEFNKDYKPKLTPPGHTTKSIIVKPVNPVQYIFLFLHFW